MRYGEKRVIIYGMILILITISITPIYANENKENISLQSTQINKENILAYITIEWESFFATWDLRDLPPKVNLTQSDKRVFNFIETDGVIKMDFTVVCKQRLLNRTLLPRLVRFDLIINHNNERVFDKVKWSVCYDLVWKNSDIVVGPNDIIYDVVTNGQNATLNPKIGVRPLPTLFLFSTGIYKELEPITVVPIT